MPVDPDERFDHRPAPKPPTITEDGRFLRWDISVRGIGVLVIITDSDPSTGRIAPHSAACA